MRSAWKLLPACALLLLSGCRVNKPGAMEGKIAKEVKHKITVGGKNVTNPVTTTPKNIAEGRAHFGHHCAICHGLDGEASGVPFADKMSPPVPSFSSKDVAAILVQKSKNVFGPNVGSKVAKAVAVRRGVTVGRINLQFVYLAHLVHLC
jgi:hypothetical protein